MKRQCPGPDELGVAAPGEADHLIGDVHARAPGTAPGQETEGATGAEADLEDVLAWPVVSRPTRR